MAQTELIPHRYHADPDVREEAIWALARRKDAQGMRMLLDRLLSDRGGYLDQETAAHILGLSLNDGATDDQLWDGLRELIKQSAREND